MYWTEYPPVKEGWYWTLQVKDEVITRVVCVYDEGGTLFVPVTGEPTLKDLVSWDESQCYKLYWAGPIEIPSFKFN